MSNHLGNIPAKRRPCAHNLPSALPEDTLNKSNFSPYRPGLDVTPAKAGAG